MIEAVNHSGYLVDCGSFMNNALDEKPENGKEKESTGRDDSYSYDYADGEIVIHAWNGLSDINGANVFLGREYGGDYYLFYSQLPVEEHGLKGVFHNYRHKIDFLIKKYKENIKYYEAVFEFEELQYFCPSSDVVRLDQDNNVLFLNSPNVIKSFTVNIDSIQCNVSITIRTAGKHGLSHVNMETITELRILFPETSDLLFLKDVYLTVDSLFAFVCNRRNTTCLSMKLIGNHPSRILKKGEIIDIVSSGESEAFFFDRYREESEGMSVISKTWEQSGFLKHLDKLFEMVASDISGDEDKGTISISSIHPSIKRRNLIDLQQSLQITGAFEFYVRTYLPPMAEEKEHHRKMRGKLETIYDESSGKLKKLAKDIMDNLVREPALEVKVVKVYKGYKDWKSLKTCFSDEWFTETDVMQLSNEVNQWRNELAHSKREYSPTQETIRAIRLLEHMNYAIVLREIGYQDEEIKNLLFATLKR